ncbi:hypothetical protein [Streptomyces sp. NPDC000133]|uniref:hypothetical protein n=1 Tax=Streptomyces sp. NPDC000133 TaxID=3364535 RepID=UPI003674363A
MIRIPEAFVRSTVEREGERGAAWLAELPGIVEELLGRWGCVPDGEVMHRGVVQAAFWGRRHGFSTARSGSRLDRLTEFVDRLAELLTEGA